MLTSGEFSGMTSIVPPYPYNGRNDIFSLLKEKRDRKRVKFIFFSKLFLLLFALYLAHLLKARTAEHLMPYLAV
jgi:hypothetical protein